MLMLNYFSMPENKTKKKNANVKRKSKIKDMEKVNVVSGKNIINIENKINVNSEKKIFKKKEISNKKAYALIALVIVVILIALYFAFVPQYKYSFNVGGLPYYSNYYTPTEFSNFVKNLDVVYVSPALVETNVNPSIVNAMNLWQVVLIMNGVDAVQLVRAVDSQGKLLYCSTNNGDPTQNIQLSIDECNNVMNNNFVVKIETGNEKVILEANSITIYSSSAIISNVNFAVIKDIFPNAQEALDIVNEKIYGIN